MDAEILFEDRMFVVTRPPNKWLRRRKIALAELEDEHWILSPLEVDATSPLFTAFRAAGIEVPRARIVSASLNLRNSLLATGRFLTLVPGSVLRFGPEHLSFRVLPVELPRWRTPTAIMSLKRRTLSPAAQLFIDCARELAKPLARMR
jgi:DNA-binding transcriptional LysR family regulator